MIDLAAIQARIAVMAEPTDETTVTRRCLEQMLAELGAARSAQQREGAAFGLKGRSL